MRNDYDSMTEDAKFKKLVRQEEFILEATEALAIAVERSGMNRAQLAKKLGCTRGFISQLLAGGRNLTLRTISDVAFALGVKPKLSVCADDRRMGCEVESVGVDQWTKPLSPKIVLHASFFTRDDNERREMIA